jgi:hypothetical protein
MNDDCDGSTVHRRSVTGSALRISDGVSGNYLLRHKGAHPVQVLFQAKYYHKSTCPTPTRSNAEIKVNEWSCDSSLLQTRSPPSLFQVKH